MSKRRVTDFWALAVFVVIFGSFVTIVTYAIVNGHPKRLFLPANNNGEFCGESRSRKTNLAIFDYSSASVITSIFSIYRQRQFFISAKSLCVETCPSWVGVPTVDQHFCVTPVSIIDADTLAAEIKSGNCAPFNIPTVSWYNYCLPDFKKLRDSGLSDSDLVTYVKLQSVYDFLNLWVFLEKIHFVHVIILDTYSVEWWIALLVFFSFVFTVVLILLIGFGNFPVFCLLYICGIGIVTTGRIYAIA
ncbi:Choline transporter-like protein 5-A [Thelohanellus kitauei]|uniref:Choline transporter-like protein 5-A n=1 Tax=Thelohanellus kitauei TaxID=669202 RepID=A0A0C2MIN7_THEKT|nr:Choline transporter-like protein 5-A [Thelohanellus kitauei]